MFRLGGVSSTAGAFLCFALALGVGKFSSLLLCLKIWKFAQTQKGRRSVRISGLFCLSRWSRWRTYPLTFL